MEEILKYKDFLDNIKKILNNNLDVFIYEIRNFVESQLIAKYIVSLTIKDNKIMEIAINELLINSIEHGMLEINYSLKSQLLKNNQWDQYIEEKLKELPNNKCVKMFFKKTVTPNTILIEVLDGGKGFNLDFLQGKKRNSPFLERHGRGGMLIELGLPNLKYNELANGAVFYITCNIEKTNDNKLLPLP